MNLFSEVMVFGDHNKSVSMPSHSSNQKKSNGLARFVISHAKLQWAKQYALIHFTSYNIIHQGQGFSANLFLGKWLSEPIMENPINTQVEQFNYY